MDWPANQKRVRESAVGRSLVFAREEGIVAESLEEKGDAVDFLRWEGMRGATLPPRVVQSEIGREVRPCAVGGWSEM